MKRTGAWPVSFPNVISPIVIGFVLIGAMLIAACAKPYHEENERYVFVATNIELPYWQEANAGFMDAAKSLGVRAELVGPTGYQPNAELLQFREIVEKQPAGICLSAGKPEIFQADIDKAIAEGIPVICVDADVPGSKRVLYIGTDNVKAGRESLKQMAELVNSGGSIAVITISGQRNLDDRVAGIADALKNFPKMNLAKILDDQGDTRTAFDLTSDLIQKKEKIVGIICVEATGGSGAAGALHRFSLEGKLPIVAFDGDPETLDGIDRGAIAASVTQKPYVMSYYGLKFLDDLHHNAVHQFKDWRTALAPPVPTFVDTGTLIVDKNNLKLYREALSAHPKPM
ncbi:MAG TPA: substrate-binding domain-containing protein [Candidatus Sulfotelmatobacter sp.]|jgi:ribose transport system substrate-binding protein|nr:substrate-binding domain-containing protein [Candidatus Sulfotelmatobacter sp.]